MAALKNMEVSRVLQIIQVINDYVLCIKTVILTWATLKIVAMFFVERMLGSSPVVFPSAKGCCSYRTHR